MDQQQVPAYQVESTQDTMLRTEQGTMERAKRVNVRFADGTRSFVEVAFGPGWPDMVAQHVEQLWQEHQQVMSVQGPMVPAPRPTMPLNPRIGT